MKISGRLNDHFFVLASLQVIRVRMKPNQAYTLLWKLIILAAVL